MIDDLMDSLPGCLIAVLVLGILSIGAAVVVDGFYGRAAFDETTACEAQRAVARRKAFSTKVICIPENRRQDTTTVRLDVKDTR